MTTAQAQDHARTPWQTHQGEGVIHLDTALAGMGTLDNDERATIPAATDAGWVSAPDPEDIGFGGKGQSKIDRSGLAAPLREGGRLHLFPDRRERAQGRRDPRREDRLRGHGRRLAHLDRHRDVVGGAATGDLEALITQVDACANDNRLDSAHVTISGQNVRVAVEPELPITVRLLACSVLDQVRGSATAAPDHYMAVEKGTGIIRQDLEKGTVFEVVVIDQAAKIIALRVADGPAKGRFLAVRDKDARLVDSQDDKRAQFHVRAPLEPALGSFVSLESVDKPGEYLRHAGYVLMRDAMTLMSASLPRRDVTFEVVPAD
jgi:hypothetical protein